MSHVDPFNALGGFSIGIPPELVIDENGNVVNNVNAPNANVTANRIFANSYLYANGQPLSIGAAGSNTQVQYNNAGLLGASSAFTFNSATNLLTVTKLQVSANANLGNVANVVILGGTNGYFLQTDGAGNLTWAPAGNGGNTGNGTPGGANTQVQFNDAGNFAGDAGFTYNKTTNVLSVSNTIAAGNAITGVNLAVTDATVYNNVAATNVIASNITLSANITSANWINASYFAGNGHNLFGLVGANVVGQVAFANVANNVAGANVSGQVGFANVANNVAGANVSGQVGNALVAGTVYNSTQSNITSVGNLTSLTVIGNTTLGNQVVSNYFIGNLFGLANLARNVTLPAQPNITSLGTLTSLTVSGNTTLGNSTTSNYFVGNLYGVANSALIANVANVATLANTANIANIANYANFTNYVEEANVANIAYEVSGSNVDGQVANALVAGTVYTAAQPNITSVGTLTSLTVTGNVAAGNVLVDGGFVRADYFVGPLATGSQPNITSVGTLTSLDLSGNITNANWIYATYFAGNAYNLSYIVAANVVGEVANAAYSANAGHANTATSATFATTAGTVTTAAQPNITSLGTLTGLTVNGTSNLGAAENVKITGGTNGYVLSTDGLGNLSWVAGGNGGGNGSPAGSNTQLQYNNAGSFGASPNLTWNNSSRVLFVGGNAAFGEQISAGTFAGNNVNTTTLTASANITAGNVNGGNLVAANFVTGTLTTNSQPNINFVGNLGYLNVNTGVAGGNGNITFNGTLRGLGAASDFVTTGNIDAGNFVQANYLIGTITTTSQPNITSLGNLSSLVVTGTTNLGNVGNITITGGSNNYVLRTDGAGNLSWVAQSGGGNGSPAGLNTYIQFNDDGAFGGDNALTWNKTTNYLFIGGNANASGVITAPLFISNIATGSAPFTVESTTPVANLGVETAGTVRNAAQPNITSLGTLTSLAVSGNTNTANLNVTNTFNAGNITTPGTIGTTNLNVTGLANFSSNAYINSAAVLYVNGNVNASGSPNVNLGSISNLHISGGINGYVLSTDGAGNLSWAAGGGGGGNGSPGGSNTQIQYNKAGTFGGSSALTFNEATNNVQVAGNLIANTFTMGAGIYGFSYSNVYFATTASAAADQVILSIDADDIAAIDFTIVSTDTAGSTRNYIKISTVVYGNSINYVEYSTLPVNGYIGDFTIGYNAGNLVSPASIELKLSPQSSNSMSHKMMVTTYKE